MIDIFRVIALIGIAIGSYTDFKTLEVPDWINYFLISAGLGGNLIYSMIEQNPNYILSSILGLSTALFIGYGMYLTGQWGGGDSKMLFGIGALIGISYPFEFGFFFKFIINLVFAGAAFGLIWILIKGIQHRKELKLKIRKYMKKYSKTRLISSLLITLILISLFFIKIEPYYKITLLVFLASMYVINYLFVIVKAVEESAMIKYVEPEKLTEGDWIPEEIYVNKKLIAGPKYLGIKKEQISLLLKYKKQGKIDKVKVKYGMPFVPSFLIAFILTLVIDNVVFFAF
jgi:Flp pilus assembly protein protease CpaA